MSEPLQHVSDLLLDRAGARELSAAALAALEAHLAQCGDCRARQQALSEQRSAFLQQAPSWQAFERRGRRQPRRATGWLVRSGLTVALAASVWLGFVRPQPALDRAPATGLRSKGGPQLGFYVKRGARVWRGRDQQTLRAGDVLRYTYSTPQPAYFALFGRDGNGKAATALFPVGAQASRVNAGVEVPLDFGLTLDAEPSAPTIHALFCREPFAIEPQRLQLTDANASTPPIAAGGCSWHTYQLHREP
jgi:hypothetical protein